MNLFLWQLRLVTLLEGRNVAELSRSMGFPSPTLGNIAREGRIPSPERRAKIAESLDVDELELWGDDAERKRFMELRRIRENHRRVEMAARWDRERR